MKRFLTKRISLLVVLTVMCMTTTLATTGWLLHSQRALAASSGPALTVDAAAGRHTISSGIYGMAQDVSSSLQQEIKLPLQRWGGDYATRYNWLQDSSNAGNDWFFMGGSGTNTPTAGATVDKIVKSQKDVGGQSLVTIPIIGYVNKTSVWNCSYPSSQYPPQQGYNPYVKLANGDQCGNGKDTNGNGLADKDIFSNHIQVDPTWMKAWLQHIIQNYGNSASSGVLYQLDNEPENWDIVHSDVHPGPSGYDELVNASTSYAAMIKSTDISAQVMGPSNGYSYGFVHLGLGGKSGDDMASHNGMAWLPYYLQQMKNYQDQHGTRLLDYLDVHYYGDHSDNNDDTTSNAARLDSTRALWDPSYTGPNSLGQYLSPPQKIGEIPALQNWIQQYYPGTKLSISEYDFGNHKNLNGALTQADVLGIFGRQGLDSAALWDIPAATDPTAYAYRMYLNYDGKGSHFGETSVQSTSADQGQLSVYGAQRSSDNALTLTIVNKTGNDLSSSLALNNFTAASNAQVYTYSGANLQSIVRQSDLSVNNNSFNTTYPANSITTVVIPGSSGGNGGGAVPNGRYTVVDRNSGMVVDDADGGGSGNQLIQWPSFSNLNQQWDVTSVGGGYYKITNVGNGLAIDVAGGSTNQDVPIVLQSYTGSDSQLWQLTATDSGYYLIVNKHSGKVIGVTGAWTAQGVPLIQWPSNGSIDQHWKFQPV